MDLKEICEKAGCTEKDIVDAMIVQSKVNQALHYQAKREAEEKAKSIEASFKALKRENEQMSLLCENWRLSKLMKEMDNERRVAEQERESSKRIISETPPLATVISPSPTEPILHKVD